MRILILKIYRYGDVIQTLQLLRAARQKFPQATIEFITSSRFLQVFDGVRDVDQLLLLHSPTDPPLCASSVPLRVFASDDELVRDLQSSKYDIVINYSSDDRHMRLGSAPKAECRYGSFFSNEPTTDHGFQSFGRFPLYLSTCIWFRRLSSLNIVDRFLMDAELPIPQDEDMWPMADDHDRSEALLATLELDRSRPIACLQPGCADPARRWPAESFGAVGDALTHFGFQVLLVGSASEVPLCSATLASMKHPPSWGVGLNLTEMRALLRRTSWLVTNDTGPMHLAAGLGARTLATFVAHSSPADTGAYRSGSISLMADLSCAPCHAPSECRIDLLCKRAITPEIAIAALGFASLAREPRQVGIWRAERHPILGVLAQRRMDPGIAVSSEVLRELVAEAWFRAFFDGSEQLSRPHQVVQSKFAVSHFDATFRDELVALREQAQQHASAIRSAAAPSPCTHTALAFLPELARVLPYLHGIAGENRATPGVLLARFMETVAEEAEAWVAAI